MKLDPRLPQLPSLSELLEHPRVKGVVERINRSTIAQRATGFLDELRSSLADHAGRVEIPSVGHLAERLVRRLLGEPAGGGPIINATGLVLGEAELTPPLADVAAQAMLQQASEYHSRAGDLRQAAERELCQLTGGQAALATANFEAALTVALSVAASGGEGFVVESATAADSGLDWQLEAARSGVALRIVAGDQAALKAALAQTRPAAIVRSPAAAAVVSMAEAAGAARQCGAALIDATPLAGVRHPAAELSISMETIGERLAAGAELVVVDGAGLIGGPSCGLIVGQRRLVEQATRHPLAALASLDPLAAAGLHATLTAYRDDEAGVVFTVPVWQLLSTPLANLQQRAERLAALIAALPTVASAEARPCETPWRREGAAEATAPGWCIAVRPKEGDAASLSAALRKSQRPIVAPAVGDCVELRLRSVFPRWDQQLVAAVEHLDA